MQVISQYPVDDFDVSENKILEFCEYFGTLSIPSDKITLVASPTNFKIEGSVGGQPQQSAEGNLAIVPPQADSVALFSSFSTFIVFIDQAKCVSIWREISADGGEFPSELSIHSNAEQVRALAQIASQMCASGQANSSLCMNAITSLILAAIALNEGRTSGRVRRLDQGRMTKIEAYIDQHIDTDLRLQDLAAYVGLSSYQLSRAFKSAAGISIKQFVIGKRLSKAKEMLLEPESNLAEIAYASGFSSQSHFTDTFRRRLGVTPGAYRRAWC